MAGIHHKLRIGLPEAGLHKTLEAWGIAQCTVTTGNLMGELLTFEIPKATGSTPICNLGDPVKLFDPSGTCRFAGIAGQPYLSVEGAQETWIYRIYGGDFFLARVPYKQPWRFPAEVPAELVGPATEMNEVEVSLVTLFRDYANGAKVDLYEQLADALQKADAFITAEGWQFGYNLAHVPHDTSPFTDTTNVEPPEDEKRDLSVLDVIETCLQWVPYVSARWDYTDHYPVLRFSAAAAIHPGTNNLIPGGTIYGDGMTKRIAAVTDLKSCKPQPLDERLVKTLRINYLIENSVVDGAGETIIWREVETDTSTVNNGAFGEHIITVPLRGHLFDGETYTQPEPRPPEGMAIALHQAFARVWWKFSLGFVGQDVDWRYQAGEGWNITGMGTGPNTANAVAQVITRDIMTGETVIECGPPSHMGYDDLTALLFPNRFRTVPHRAGAQQYGFDKEDRDPNDGTASGTWLELMVTVGGEDVERTFRIKTPPASP